MNLESTIQTNIISKAKQGDSNAFEWLYNNYCKAMFSICLKMVGSKENAEDVLHDVFVIAFKNLHQLKSDVQFAGWLKRITINECLRYTKKQFTTQDWQGEQTAISNEDETPWWLNININTVASAIKDLPNGCRQIFYLYTIEDYTHKQIATTLNISEGTSKSQYSRAKKLLKEVLQKNNYLQ